ncbi:MAG: cytochrome c biogenesis protein CcdA [Propionibacteriales bacterium]|nr:cytochrome c biogenesis protein CcdA [Propionibacteriales bacterium]
MEGLPLGLAVAAGMVAVVNPCGFALLPAYVSLLVVGTDSPGRAVVLGRALAFAAAMTAGFTLVFGLFGLLLTLVSTTSTVQRYLPWFTLILGGLLLMLGVWLLVGRTIPGLQIAATRPAVTRSASSMAIFGASYATASLSCTLAPFLATVVAGFRAESVADGVTVFGAYAVGMGLVIVTLSLAVALARSEVVTWLRRAGRLVPRFGGVLLVVAGAYVAYFGWYEIRVLRGGNPSDPVMDAGGRIQRWLADGLDRLGTGGMAAAALALAGLAVVLAWRARYRNRTPVEAPKEEVHR